MQAWGQSGGRLGVGVNEPEEGATEVDVARVGPAAVRLALGHLVELCLHDMQAVARREQVRPRVELDARGQFARLLLAGAQLLGALEVQAAALAQVVHARHQHLHRLQPATAPTTTPTRVLQTRQAHVLQRPVPVVVVESAVLLHHVAHAHAHVHFLLPQATNYASTLLKTNSQQIHKIEIARWHLRIVRNKRKHKCCPIQLKLYSFPKEIKKRKSRATNNLATRIIDPGLKLGKETMAAMIAFSLIKFLAYDNNICFTFLTPSLTKNL